MIMATKALLATNPDPSEEDVKDYLSGNLCRCGTYIEVLQAVKRARELGTSSS
jgi:nicotinate dehydrogenase subunit A